MMSAVRKVIMKYFTALILNQTDKQDLLCGGYLGSTNGVVFTG
jgi:hypothetical protein